MLSSVSTEIQNGIEKRKSITRNVKKSLDRMSDFHIEGKAIAMKIVHLLTFRT